MVPAGSAPSQEGSGSSPGESVGESGSEAKTYRSKEQLMLRANSLKKALRQIIEQAEKGANIPLTQGTTEVQGKSRFYQLV